MIGRGSLPAMSSSCSRETARGCTSESGTHGRVMKGLKPFTHSTSLLFHLHSSPPQVLFSRVAQQGQLTVRSPLRPVQGDGEPRHGRLRHDLPVLPGGFQTLTREALLRDKTDSHVIQAFFLIQVVNQKDRKSTVDVFKHLNLIEHLKSNANCWIAHAVSKHFGQKKKANLQAGELTFMKHFII